MCPMPLSGIGRRGRNFTDRTSTLLPETTTEPLAAGLSGESENDMKIIVPESVLGVKEWECEVISNKNVATFIKEFIVALPPGEHMNFIPGSYAQIKIPAYTMDYDKISIKASSEMNTCFHGKNSGYSD